MEKKISRFVKNLVVIDILDMETVSILENGTFAAKITMSHHTDDITITITTEIVAGEPMLLNTLNYIKERFQVLDVDIITREDEYIISFSIRKRKMAELVDIELNVPSGQTSVIDRLYANDYSVNFEYLYPKTDYLHELHSISASSTDEDGEPEF